jgi:hypothetical protein
MGSGGTTCHENALLRKHARPSKPKRLRLNQPRTGALCKKTRHQANLYPLPKMRYTTGHSRRAAAYLNNAVHRSCGPGGELEIIVAGRNPVTLVVRRAEKGTSRQQ